MRRSWALGAFLLGAFAFLDVVSVLFVLGAGLMASWVLPERGASQFWAAGGAALGVAVAVYVDPIAAPREFGALGLILIATAGLLAALHLAATLGSRREFRWEIPLVPKHVPVVTLLAVWVAIALMSQSDARHQVRTQASGEPPGSLSTAVRAWLTQEATGTEERVPMVVVAASGGRRQGRVLDRPRRRLPVRRRAPDRRREGVSPAAGARSVRGPFLTSSVSGGSIG